MKRTLIFGSMILLLGSLFALNVQPAYALIEPEDESNHFYCDLDGGIWYGDDDENGTCYFPPGSELDGEYQCEANEYIWIELAGDEILGDGCSSLPVATTSAYAAKPGFGKCGNVTSKSAEGTGYLYLKCQKNSFIYYNEGTCAGKCTISPTLISTAKTALKDLDGDPSGAMYVKLRDTNGSPSFGNYQACFINEGLIYRYVGGVWIASYTSISEGVSCTTANGDGNFVLIEN